MSEQEVLSKKLDTIAVKINKESKVYGIITIILSALDVLTGIICIFLTSLQITAIATSVLSGTVIGSRAIQLLKTRNLLKTITLINGMSASYILTRVKKGEYMKKFLNANKWSIILATGIGGIVGCSSYFLLPLVWAVAPLWASILIACGIGIIVWLMVFFLGKEKTIQYILRVATKYLPEDKVKEVITLAQNYSAEVEALEAQKEAENKAKAEKAQAEKILADYKAKQEIIENAKKLLEEKK